MTHTARLAAGAAVSGLLVAGFLAIVLHPVAAPPSVRRGTTFAPASSEPRLELATRRRAAAPEAAPTILGDIAAARSPAEIIPSLRAARARGDPRAAAAEKQALRVGAGRFSAELCAALRSEVVAAGDPPVVADICDVIRETDGHIEWVTRLAAESLALLGDEGDAQFAARTQEYYLLVCGVASRGGSMAPFEATVRSRTDRLDTSRRFLFEALASLRRTEFIQPLRSVAEDATESVGTRIAASRAVLSLDAAAGIACFTNVLGSCTGPGVKGQVLDAVACSQDYESAYAFTCAVIDEAGVEANTRISLFAMQLASANGRRDARRVATFLLDRADAELAVRPERAGSLLQGLGAAILQLRTLRAAVAEDAGLRSRVHGLADGDSHAGEFVESTAAALWAATLTDPDAYFATVAAWRDAGAAAARGAILNGAFIERNLADAESRSGFRSRFRALVEELLVRPRAAHEPSTALSACQAGNLIELAIEVRRIAEDPSRNHALRAQAARVLEHLARKAAGK